MNGKIDLAWGDPLVVRQALTETLGKGYEMAFLHLERMKYPPHLGEHNLIEQLKDLTARQIGKRPKHLMVTCGASGAISAAIHALRRPWTEVVITGDRYYPFYHEIVKLAGLSRFGRTSAYGMQNDYITEAISITLVDSPSNPDGLVYPFEEVDIYDAAYASATYSQKGHVPSKYKVVCGSLSKTLGLPGLRLGWVATDEDLLVGELTDYVTATYVGLSSLSMAVAEEILSKLDFARFEEKSRLHLDSNREEIQKVLDRFGQPQVSSRGMFALIELGKAERKALEKAGIRWQCGTTFGGDENLARINLGADREVIKKVVKEILK